MEVKEPSAKYLVRPGLKRTEIGLIPEDWEMRPLHTLAEKIMVGIASAATHAYRDRGIVMLRNQNIKPGYLDDSDILYIDETYEETYRNKRLKTGDLLTARTGYPGTTSIVPSKYEGAQSFTTLITRLRRGVIDSEYLCCFINSEVGQNYFEQNQIGGGQKNVNAGSLKYLPVPLPPTKSEQVAIAEALSDADALIESLVQLLSKKRHLKQGAMQELLTGKRRLPGFGAEWVVKRLAELADIRSGGTPSTTQPQFWDGEIPWCTPTDITGLNGFKYLSDTSRKISIQGLNGSSAEMIPADSIVMTSRATIGECAINTIPVSTNQGFKNFVPFENVDAEFLYYMLRMQKQGFISLCGGSTFLEIGKTQLAIYEMRVPSTKTEQTAIADILSDMDAELAELEVKLAKARSFKQGMMQELLTGRIRLV